ncbi:GMC family oxidoreductase N-terminal domain-containing protein [Thermogemmatispora sp.]|uniref:GMC family oxidoreductase n=1 Tax=Thermogemmatispora sp. TaxID=1968838 RepID=UPI0035E40D94
MTISSTVLSPILQRQSQGATWLSPGEFAILEVVCDTLLPSLEPPPGVSAEEAAYYRRRAADLQVAQRMAEMLALESEERKGQIRQLLALLRSPLTSLVLVGRPQPFARLPQELRERYLLALANSPLGLLRQGFQAMKRLAGFIFFAALDERGRNPNWEVLDYAPPQDPPASLVRPLQPFPVEGDTVLEADAVVIGSGAGGGVVAGELARAGKSVVVLEKGGYYNEETFPVEEGRGMTELYLQRGLLTSRDLGITVLAGSTLGGGTVVNWMTSFRTPEDILDEWAKRSGVSELTGQGLQASFAAVEERISVNLENSAHNRQNQVLADGCTALGYHAGVLRRNAVGCNQRCGTCCFGCRYGCKQSTLKTYLQDAFEAGARIIVNCSAERVLIEQGRAVGVLASVRDPQSGRLSRLTVRARAVIVAAGAIHSPAILLRSGLSNPHIGRHLYLHPTAVVAGLYPDKIYPWKGVLQSAYSNQFGHLDGTYGYKLETAPVHPGMLGVAMPWWSARDYRRELLQAPYVAAFIVLTRDRGEGRVSLARDGEPVIDYVVSVYDRRHLLHGIGQAARVHFAAGARSVLSLHTRRTRLDRAEDGALDERQFRNFERQLERHGLAPNRLMVFTAHQMGTCRMGNDPRQAVVDGNHEVHGVRGLFVCDGSVFPSPSGVNPMLSIMALAHRAAQYIKSTL